MSELLFYLRKVVSPFCRENVMDPRCFENVGRVSDWRNHVPDNVRCVWNKLSEKERLLVVAVAEQAASQEEWD